MISEIHELLQALNREGIKMWVQDGNLRLRAPQGALTPAWREQISLRRDELVTLLGSIGEETLQTPPSGPATGQEQGYPVSPAQYRIWAANQLKDDLIMYNVPRLVRLIGALDREALQKAFELLVGRHESLRTAFITVDGIPRQVVREVSSFEFDVIQWPGAAQEEVAKGSMSQALWPLDLEKDPLFQAFLLCTSKEESYLFLLAHRIIADDRTFDILNSELGLLYDACKRGKTPALPSLPMQCRDDAVRRQEPASGASDSRRYWQGKLAHPPRPLDLPADYPRPQARSFQGNRLTVSFGTAMLHGLQALGRGAGATLFETLTALVKCLLFRYSGQRDIIVGAVSGGRDYPGLENLAGFFTNLLPLRDEIREDLDFLEFLHQVKQTCREAFAHAAYPFGLMVEEAGMRRDARHSPFFDVVVLLQEQEPCVFRPDNLTVKEIPLHLPCAGYELTFGFTTAAGSLGLCLEYSTSLFSKERMECMATHFECLLKSIVENPRLHAGQLPDLQDFPPQRQSVHDGRRTLAGADNGRPASETVQALAAIWEDLLKNQPAGKHGDFFKMGGHSFLAIQLAAAIEKRFGVVYPPPLIFQYPALVDMARQIDEMNSRSKKKRPQPGIWFNPAAAARVFAFPPVFGLGIGYKKLADAMPGIALFSFDFIPSGDRLGIYFGQIKKQQPTGPYILMGYSLGGNLAFEMALFMEKRGCEVSDIVMGDSFVGSHTGIFDQARLRKKIKAKLFWEFLGREGTTEVQSKTILNETEERMRAYLCFAENMRTDSAIHANIHLLKAGESATESADFNQDWGSLTKGKFTVYTTPGTHYTQFNDGNLPELAGILKKIVPALTANGNHELTARRQPAFLRPS